MFLKGILDEILHDELPWLPFMFCYTPLFFSLHHWALGNDETWNLTHFIWDGQAMHLEMKYVLICIV